MQSEAYIQQQTRLMLAERRALMARNNVGACEDRNGRVIRYGLFNESALLNKRIKSSDLIGAVPTLITQDHVGMVLGVFTALECKHEGWTLTAGDARGHAQARFHQLVLEAGGYAGFVSGLDDVRRIIGERG